MEKEPVENRPDVERIAAALKAAGIVIPLDFGFPVRLSAELAKRRHEPTPEIGGFVLTHYAVIWRN
jgi:hypothetical protein